MLNLIQTDQGEITYFDLLRIRGGSVSVSEPAREQFSLKGKDSLIAVSDENGAVLIPAVYFEKMMK